MLTHTPLTAQVSPDCGDGIVNGAGEQCDSADPDLIAYYPMHIGTGTIAYDYSLNNYHAQLVNGPIWSQSTDAKIIEADGGIQFDGKDDHLNLGTHSDFNFQGNDFSVSIWTYFDGNTHYLFTKGDYNDKNSINLLSSSAGSVHFRTKNIGKTGTTHGQHSDDLVATSVLQMDTWHHIVFTRDDATNTKRIYIDGVEQASSVHDFIVSNSHNAGVGAANNVGTWWKWWETPGVVDDLRMYSKVLSLAEITALSAGRDATDCTHECVMKDDYVCGNTIPEDILGEECDQGPANSDTTPNACREHCISATCGDGVVDTEIGEQCDNGDLNLIAYFPLHEGHGTIAHDHSWRKNHATLVNGPVWVQSSAAKIVDTNGGLQFDGKDDHLDLGNDDIYNFGHADFSVSAWVYHQGNSQYIFTKGDLYQKDAIGLQTTINGKVMFRTKDVGKDNVNDGDHLTTESVLQLDTWHHITFTRDDATDTKRIYVDGVEQASSQHYFIVFNGHHAGVGGTNNVGTWWKWWETPGVIDDIRIYNKTLSQAEITQLSALRDPITCTYECQNRGDINCGNTLPDPILGEECDRGPANSDTTPDACREHCLNATCGDGVVDPAIGEQCDAGDLRLIAYYPMHEGHGTVVHDHSWRGNDATMEKGPIWIQSSEARIIDPHGGIQFDGTNDYLDLGSDDIFNFGHDDFTVSAWVYYEGNTSYIFMKGIFGDKDTIQLLTDNDRAVKFRTKPAGQSNGTFPMNYAEHELSTPQVLEYDTWHHITFTRDDATNTRSIYVDGVLQASDTQYFLIFNSKNAEVMRKGSSWWEKWKSPGIMDDLRIYSATLSDAEITQLASQRDPVACTHECMDRADINCGSGTPDAILGQECDDGSGNSDTEPNMCRTHCLNFACGDGVIDTDANEQCDVGDIDLIAYYPLHEGGGNIGHDFSWRRNDATFNGDPAWLQSGDATFMDQNGGLEFDDDDYLDLGNSTLFNFGHNDFTVAAWVYYQENTSYIFTKGDASSDQFINLITVSDGTARFRTQEIGERGSIQLGMDDLATPAILQNETWHHITFTREDTTNTKRIYIDGVEQASAVHDFIVQNGNHAAVMGYNNAGTWWKWRSAPGVIDDIRVYNKRLTDTQIADLAFARDPTFCKYDCSPYCGNGELDFLETCDPNMPGAPANCRPYPDPAYCTYCGDDDIQSEAGETCDDNNTDNNDGCSSMCLEEICGDGIPQTSNNVGQNEDCDTAGESATCNDDCTTPTCGDGNTNEAANEQCDDGNTDDGDGCSSACQIEIPSDCGNGTVEGDEQCDDEGESATCNTNCTFSSCGDGIPNAAANEDCDTAGESATCNDDCTTPICGDGNTNEAANESCDDGNTDSGDGCSSTCQTESPIVPVCGNGTPEGDEQCDTAGESATCDDDCTAVTCGDGNTNEAANESCDDSNTIDGDGCSSSCRTEVTPVCGNGTPEGDEQCDEGGETATCTSQCTISFCGDSITNIAASEDCDTAGESATCNADCTSSICGDTITNTTANESCDDGNTDDGDGCSSACQIEIPPNCGNGTVEGDEQCDDSGESATCNINCTLSACGDSITNSTAQEDCDTGGDSTTCDRDCTDRICGDGYANIRSGEQCDDGNTDDNDECTSICIRQVTQSSSAPSPQPQTHGECQDNQCIQVEGEGTNECDFDSDCRDTKNYTACFRFECVVVAGQGDDQCTAHAHCLDDYHTICEDDQCKFVGGEGENECIDDDQCIPEVTETHGECIQNQCVRIAGPGPDECIQDTDCNTQLGPHTECQNDQCIVVDTPGSNECINDSDCIFKAQGHTECRDEQCIAVDASGFDECINDSDCFERTDFHTECQNDQCIQVQGPGSNECINAKDCIQKAQGHTQCQDNQCIIIPGSGTDQCVNHSDCDPALSLQHAICEDNACIVKEGSGVNQCINDSDCIEETHQAAQTHTQCQNDQCIEVSGPGINFCSTDTDCQTPKHTICQSNLCIVIPGEGDNECTSDENCIDVLPATNVASASMCGDGVIQAPEECDDSNTRNNDGCSSTCTEESIPDFIYQPQPTIEQPEDKDTEVLSVAISNESIPTLERPLCGNNILNTNEECDLGLHNSDTQSNACRTNCMLPTCGDSVIDLDEECDDGNRNNNDTCTNTCTKKSLILQPNPNPILDSLKPAAPTPIIAHQPTASTIPFKISRTNNQQPVTSNYQSVQYQIPVRYQIPQRAPIGDTGPATAVIIALGSALGYSIRKRKQVN